MDVRRVLAFASCALLVTHVAESSAEPAKRAGGEDTARFQIMLQQLTTEKTNLSQENAKLKAELDKTKAQLEALTKERATAAQKSNRDEQELANSRAKTDAVQRGFDELKSRFDQLVDQFRTTVASMKELEQERDGFNSESNRYQTIVAACERNNEALYKADLELIGLYEHKGVMTALLQREPVTQLKRVELENLMDRYRSTAADLRVQPATLDSAARSTSDAGE